MLRVLLATVLAVCCTQVATSLERLAEQRTIIFERLGPEDGLSQGIVTAFVQDAQGFIWIGTQEGLNRYDGRSFRKYFHMEGESGSLSHDYIRKLHIDGRERLWVATDGGINLYRGEQGDFASFQLSLNSEPTPVYEIAESLDGRIWLGTASGLYVWEPDANSFEVVKGHFEGRTIRSLLVVNSEILVGTESEGLFKLDPTNSVYSRHPAELLDNDVRDILVDKVGDLWIGTFNGGLARYSDRFEPTEHFTVRSDPGSIGSDRIRSLLEDEDGHLWIGTDNGLHLYHNGGFERYQHDISNPRSIGDNTIITLYQDEGQVIWVGTYYGISKWNAGVDLFPYFRRPISSAGTPESNNITSFAETEEGNVWIGTLSGLIEWDSALGRLRAHDPEKMGLLDSKVMSLSSHSSVLWVGTMTKGIHLVKDGVVDVIYTHDEFDSDSISSNAITKMYKDSRGVLWVTTYGGGVNKHLGGGRFQRYPKNDSIDFAFPDLRCMDIVEVAEGEYWIATQGGGVVILDSNTGETDLLQHKAGDLGTIPSNEVLTLLPDENGVWIGTVNRGLAFFDLSTKNILRLSKADGLASDAIYGLLKDKNGRIWSSGGKGLSVLDPLTREFQLFDSSHGLQSSDFNSGAYAELSDGSFLFGGNNGFNAFLPERIHVNQYKPPVHITEVRLFNEPIPFSQVSDENSRLQFSHDDSVISFAFAALDYTTPEKNQYSYMLEGFDKDWRFGGSDSEVTYTNLDAGSYLFRVKGSNNDGVWNDEGTSLEFIILPAPWFTWWAYAIYFLVFVLFSFLVFQANSRRLQRSAERQYSQQLQLYIESLEEASDGIMIANAQGNLLYANYATTDSIGKTADQIVGESLYDVLFESETDRHSAKEILQNEGRYHGEVQFGGSQDQPVIHEVTIAAVQQTSTNELAYVGISRDVTRRKATESQLENYRRNLEVLVENRTQALQKEIAENKAIQVHLANSLQEKELLLKEVHHRVKNNMQVISSLLSIQADGVSDEVYSNLLNESQQRIKSMALIHETLYQSEDLLMIDFQEYIETLSTSLSRSFQSPGVGVQILVNVEDVSLDLDTAVPCGLIINELVSNALKHAFVGAEGTGQISVDFRSSGCSYDLRIADNGVGLPESFDPNRNTSMGMEIVSILTTQLEGELSFRNDHGAVFEISFPRVHAHAG